MQAALCAPRHAEATRAVQAALGVEADACEPGAAAKGAASEGVRPVRR
jgi:hypothetical protein